MKRLILYIALFLFAVAGLTACDEKYPMSWSPDGTTLAIVAEDGLRLSDTDGKLTGPLADQVRKIAWMPDSKSILMVTTSSERSWSIAKFYLTGERQQEVTDLAQHIKERLATGGTKALENDSMLKDRPAWLTGFALLYLKDTDRETLKQLLASDKPDQIDALSVTIWHIKQLAVKPDTSSPRKELWQGPEEIDGIRIAPDGNYIVFALAKPGSSGGCDLMLLSPDAPQKPSKVISAANAAFDWTCDSRSLMFAPGACGGTDCPEVGRISAVDLRNTNGIKLTTPVPARTLLYTMMPCQALQTLPDGRFIFDSAIVELPATETDVSNTATLFSFKPGDQLVHRLIAKQNLESLGSVKSLAVNKSGSTLAIRGSNGSEIVDATTGHTSPISIYTDLQPCWRNDDEVCFAQPVEKVGSNKHAAEIVLHSISKNTDRVLSKDWPSSAVNGMLIDTSKH